MASGHTGVPQYSIGRLLDEAAIVAERRNHELANAAVLVQMAIHTFPVTDSKAAVGEANKKIKDFGAAINKMIEDR